MEEEEDQQQQQQQQKTKKKVTKRVVKPIQSSPRGDDQMDVSEEVALTPRKKEKFIEIDTKSNAPENQDPFESSSRRLKIYAVKGLTIGGIVHMQLVLDTSFENAVSAFITTMNNNTMQNSQKLTKDAIVLIPMGGQPPEATNGRIYFIEVDPETKKVFTARMDD
jgi:hypothetical protein